MVCRYPLKTWVVTGKLDSMTREEHRRDCGDLAPKSPTSVSGKTTCLVAGPGAGSKLKRAQSLEIEIIDEQQLLARLASLES